MAGPPLRVADSSQEEEKSYVLSTVCAPGIFGLIEAQHHISAENTYPRTCWFQHVLGFTHSCANTRKGRFTVLRQTIRTRLQAKLRAVKTELRRRLHQPVPE